MTLSDTWDRYTLSYVNERAKVINLDKEFKILSDLVTWVRRNHPEYSSFQIIVVKSRYWSVELKQNRDKG